MNESYHASTWFVTGASGLVGSAIVRQLCEFEFNVIALVRHTSDPKIVEELQELGAKIVIGDLLNPTSFENYFAAIDIIVHTAAIIQTDNPNLYQDINVNGTTNLVDLAIEYGIRRFIHISTAGVYGNTSNSEVTESNTTRPHSPYSSSKLASEKILLKHQNDLDISILRPPFIFGDVDRDRNVLPRLYKLFSRKISVKLLFRDPLVGFAHANDIANVVVTLGGRESTSNVIYNIQSFSVRYTELVNMVFRSTNMSGNIIALPYSICKLISIPIDLVLSLRKKMFRLSSQLRRLRYNWVFSTDLLQNDYAWVPLHNDPNELEVLLAEYNEKINPQVVNRDGEILYVS